MVDGLTHEELIVACKNIGHDLTCGACAGVFFSGSTFIQEHSASCFTYAKAHFIMVCRLCHNQRGKEGKCPHCGAEVFPDDYEPCGECGFDHQYEPQSANATHSRMEMDDG